MRFAIALLALVAVCALAADTAPQLRIVNCALTTPSTFSVYFDLSGTSKAYTVKSGEIKGYFDAPMYNFSMYVTASGAPAPTTLDGTIASFGPVTLEEEQDYSILITGVNGQMNNQTGPVLDVYLQADAHQPPLDNANGVARFVVLSPLFDTAVTGNTLSVELRATDNTFNASAYELQLASSARFELPPNTYSVILTICSANNTCVANTNTKKIEIDTLALTFYTIFVESDAAVQTSLSLLVETDVTFDPSVQLRVGNFAAGIDGALDFYIGDVLWNANMSLLYSNVGLYTEVFQNKYSVVVYPTGTKTNAVFTGSVNLAKYVGATGVTLLLINPGNVTKLYARVDDLTEPSARYARVSVLNTAPNGIDATFTPTDGFALQNGQAVTSLNNIKTLGAFEAATLAEGTYAVSFDLIANASLGAMSLQFANVGVYTIFAFQNAAGLTTFNLVLDWQFVPPAPVSLVRLVNGAINAPTMSLMLNGQLMFKNVSYGKIPEYVNFTTPMGDATQAIIFYGPQAAPTVVFNKTVSTKEYTNWTFVVAGDGSTASVAPVQGFAIQDLNDIPAANGKPPTTFWKVRTINLAAYAAGSSVSVALMGAGSLASVSFNMSAGFGQPSAYQLVQAPAKVTKFSAPLAASVIGGNGTDLLDVPPARAAMRTQTVNTVFVFGAGASGKYKLRAQLVQDYPMASSNDDSLTGLELGLIIGGSVLLGVVVVAIIILAIRKQPEGYDTLPN